ncbi:MAG: DUF4390 domain-containing protein [Desulfobulbaceae bacterium]|nr:DUF4390 domain-containing protein [Desulfobulbaceae bacterium]MDY0351458.1 DUF4390 domain-containing protein [Desulfobulbaceae bacterium]
MKSYPPVILIILLFLFSALPSSAWAKDEKPYLADILLTSSQTDLLLFCTIQNSFMADMIKGVQNGIPVTFTFLVKLEKINKNWPDSTLGEMTIHHTLAYDPIKQRYSVSLSERTTGAMVTDSIDRAMEVMAELNGIKIIPLAELEPDKPYALHVKAVLAEKTLPLNLHYIVPFISLWNFETDWRTIEFTY